MVTTSFSSDHIHIACGLMRFLLKAMSVFDFHQLESHQWRIFVSLGVTLSQNGSNLVIPRVPNRVLGPIFKYRQKSVTINIAALFITTSFLR
jgi:hypothetical protein